jgi:hypothetical protein
VAGAGNDQALHVVREELHRIADVFTVACRSADRQDGHGQPPGLALLVLCDGRIERSIGPEVAAQGVGLRDETDVVRDHVVGQLPALDGELVAEEDVLPSLGELFGHLLDPVEGDVQPKSAAGLRASIAAQPLSDGG